MSKGQSDNTNNATKKFDYTAVVLMYHINWCHCYAYAPEYHQEGISPSANGEKGSDLTQSYDKAAAPVEKSKRQRDNTKNVTKTSVKQRLRTDLGRSVGATTSPTGVVKPVYEHSTIPLTATAV